MKVTNITNKNGKPIANQFIIEGAIIQTDATGINLFHHGRMFQSYESNIVFIQPYCVYHGKRITFLDSKYWKYSPTTSKYRNQFLNETTAETQAKIDSGKYILTNLN